MKDREKLRRKLDEIEYNFNKGLYDIALQHLEEAGKTIIVKLNIENKKNRKRCS